MLSVGKRVELSNICCFLYARKRFSIAYNILSQEKGGVCSVKMKIDFQTRLHWAHVLFFRAGNNVQILFFIMKMEFCRKFSFFRFFHGRSRIMLR